jgi:hypothetical protein
LDRSSQQEAADRVGLVDQTSFALAEMAEMAEIQLVLPEESMSPTNIWVPSVAGELRALGERPQQVVATALRIQR